MQHVIENMKTKPIFCIDLISKIYILLSLYIQSSNVITSETSEYEKTRFWNLKSYKNMINLLRSTLWGNMTELTKYVGTPDINKAEMIQKRLL